MSSGSFPVGKNKNKQGDILRLKFAQLLKYCVSLNLVYVYIFVAYAVEDFMQHLVSLSLVALVLVSRYRLGRLLVQLKLVGRRNKVTSTLDFTVDTSICTCNVQKVCSFEAITFVLTEKKETVCASKEHGHTSETTDEFEICSPISGSCHVKDGNFATCGSCCRSCFGSCCHRIAIETFAASGGSGYSTSLILKGTTSGCQVCKTGAGGETTRKARQTPRN